MGHAVNDFIHAKRIDSFQKLRFLLFLYRYSDLRGTITEFAERLYLGDTYFMEKIILELQQVGLLVKLDQHWKLSDEPGVKANLKPLVQAFECPLSRQKLLEQVKRAVWCH